MEAGFETHMVDAQAASLAAELAGERFEGLRYGDPGYSLLCSVYGYLHDRAMVAYMFADIATSLEFAVPRSRRYVNQ